jgi:hypothetical protein
MSYELSRLRQQMNRVEHYEPTAGGLTANAGLPARTEAFAPQDEPADSLRSVRRPGRKN